MADFFQWLSGGTYSSIFFIGAIGLILIVLVLVYTTAFFQGREIVFWPPKIGQKPIYSSSDTNFRIDTQHVDIPKRIVELEKQLKDFSKEKERSKNIFKPNQLPERVLYLLEIKLHFDSKIKALVESYSGGWAGISIASVDVFIEHLQTLEKSNKEIHLANEVIEFYSILSEILEGYTLAPVRDIDDTILLYIQYLASQLERNFLYAPKGPFNRP